MSASVGLAWRLTKLSPDREGMQIDKNVVDQLIQSTNADIRQVLNMLSTWRLSKKTMDFDEGKQL
jgi:replication factor C subunit 1